VPYNLRVHTHITGEGEKELDAREAKAEILVLTTSLS
jgi:hypothetical protein